MPRRSLAPGRLAGTPLAAAAVVLVVYGAWVAFALSRHEATDFVRVGERFATQGSSSDAIGPHLDIQGEIGYDGQFFYFLALDPANAHDYMDAPAYRYGRILYPMTARMLAAGQEAAIPYALVAVNLVALVLGTWAVGAWLARRGLSPMISLLFGLYPGLFVSLHRDLSEPLAYVFVALAMLVLDRRGALGLAVATLLFALAALSRETTLVFPAVVAGALALADGPGPRAASIRRNAPRAALLAGGAAAPLLLWKIVVAAWLGDDTPTELFARYPFHGLVAWWPFGKNLAEELVALVLPALLVLGVAVHAARRRIVTVGTALVAANVVVLVVFLPALSYAEYFAAGRITTGVVLATLYAAPAGLAATGGSTWLWLAAVLWLSPWYHFFPLAIGDWWR